MEGSTKIGDDAHGPRESVPPQDVNNRSSSMKETLTKESDIGSKTTIVKTNAINRNLAIKTINSLAEEIIDKIMTNLRDEEDTKALASLSFVSKKFHRIVEPHLYHHITVFLGSSIFGGVAGNAKELIRTLFYNDHFRKGVRMLTVVRNEAESWIGDHVRDHDYLAYKHLSRGNDNHCDSYLIALVNYLPYIETLDMSQYRWTDQARIPIFSEHSWWSRNLKNVDISIRGEFSILDLFCMFMLPSIESIAMRGGRLMPTNTENNAGLWTNSYHKSTVKHLMLKDLLYQIGELNIIAGLCTNLSSLDLYFSDAEGIFPLAYGDFYSFKNQMASASMRQLGMVSFEYGIGFRIEVKDIATTPYSP